MLVKYDAIAMSNMIPHFTEHITISVVIKIVSTKLNCHHSSLIKIFLISQCIKNLPVRPLISYTLFDV